MLIEEGGGIVMCSCFAHQQVSVQIKFKLINLKRNLVGKTQIHEYMNCPPPPINILATALCDMDTGVQLISAMNFPAFVN